MAPRRWFVDGVRGGGRSEPYGGWQRRCKTEQRWVAEQRSSGAAPSAAWGRGFVSQHEGMVHCRRSTWSLELLAWRRGRAAAGAAAGAAARVVIGARSAISPGYLPSDLARQRCWSMPRLRRGWCGLSDGTGVFLHVQVTSGLRAVGHGCTERCLSAPTFPPPHLNASRQLTLCCAGSLLLCRSRCCAGSPAWFRSCRYGWLKG